MHRQRALSQRSDNSCRKQLETFAPAMSGADPLSTGYQRSPEPEHNANLGL
jgi:hypothetical protein